MIRLEEVIAKYKPYGATDIDIIKIYFTINHIEDQAIDMLTSLCKDQIKDNHSYISFIKEYSTYNNAILDNPLLTEDEKAKLIRLSDQYLLKGYLGHDQLNLAQNIFDESYGRNSHKSTQSFICPMYFCVYLVSNGVNLRFISEKQLDMEAGNRFRTLSDKYNGLLEESVCCSNENVK